MGSHNFNVAEAELIGQINKSLIEDINVRDPYFNSLLGPKRRASPIRPTATNLRSYPTLAAIGFQFPASKRASTLILLPEATCPTCGSTTAPSNEWVQWRQEIQGVWVP
jgi:hypothetical protein